MSVVQSRVSGRPMTCIPLQTVVAELMTTTSKHIIISPKSEFEEFLYCRPNMKLPLRIAILQCDDPPENAKKKLGGYGPIFRTLLEAAADSLGHSGLSAKDGLELSYWDVMREKDKYPNPDDIDAILLSGSSESPTPPHELILKRDRAQCFRK
jgi:hypothetical protein